MNHLIRQLVASFHRVVNDRSGNDITIARAKTMLALASVTWPGIGVVVTSRPVSGRRRIVWESEAFEAITMGGAFRRDPVGDDASIIIEEEEAGELVMLEEMRECASFIPLFGRQRLERFNLVLAAVIGCKAGGVPLPPPGSEGGVDGQDEVEYRLLHDWLVRHGSIAPDGAWQEGAVKPRS